jgi:hypothetical protein
MPDDLGIAAAQFENRSGDKQFNLAAIEEQSAAAAALPAVCGRRIDRRAVRPAGHHAIL